MVGNDAAAIALWVTSLVDPPGFPVGPLWGIVAGLNWTRELGLFWMACAPCDVPEMPCDWVADLIAGSRSSLASVGCLRSANGLEPLLSVWHVELVEPLSTVMADGRHPPIYRLLQDWGASELLV